MPTTKKPNKREAHDREIGGKSNRASQAGEMVFHHLMVMLNGDLVLVGMAVSAAAMRFVVTVDQDQASAAGRAVIKCVNSAIQIHATPEA